MNDGRGETAIDDETLKRIRERTLEAERKQLHKRRPHNIIPEIEEIVREEVPE
jgi:hypothetical protein